MYTMEQITEYLEKPHDTDDNYNELKALLVTSLDSSLTEYNELKKQMEEVQKQNESLKQNNSLLYNRVESQLVNLQKLQPPKEEPEPDPEVTARELVEKNRKLYDGIW